MTNYHIYSTTSNPIELTRCWVCMNFGIVDANDDLGLCNDCIKEVKERRDSC
jgi:hypothetical protein